MNDAPQHDMLDDVAVYVLGALPPADAARVRAHLITCAECREEYARLKPVAGLIGTSASTQGDAATCPSTLLKPRVMQQIRAQARPPAKTAEPLRQPQTPAARRSLPPRSPVWPAYLVAAACVAITILSSAWNIGLMGQLKQSQNDIARLQQRSTALARNLAEQRATVSDLFSADSKHYTYGDSDVIARGPRLYVTMRNLPEPPHGKVYQAWTLAKGAKKVAPSSTFVPDAHGVAVIPLPADARTVAAVAVSVEPDGGSKQPTTKPIVIIPLS